jgi:hypothetical protein
MSDSAKKKHYSTYRKKTNDKERKRSDVEHIYRRRSNSDRSCQTERRKRLGSTIIVLCVITPTLEDRDNEKEDEKKKTYKEAVV